MADNYLGNRMDDYRAGKLTRPAPRRLTPSGVKPGTLFLTVDPKRSVWIAEGALLPAGTALIRTLTSAGIKTYYRADSGKAGSEPAIKFGARHYPPAADAPQADVNIAVTPEEILIDSGRARITFPEDRADDAAQMAAALLSSGPINAQIEF
ncbi:MAG: hypothetical protein K2K82_09330 [Muribaculaceae bacterium]|nr:hypothetical protein [Muribaculaceae bacterium]